MATKSTRGKKSKASKKPVRKVVKKFVVKKVVAKKASVKFVPTKLKLRRPVPSDIEIAQEARIKPILQVAAELGIRENELELYGPYKAKVKLEILERLKNKPNGKYIDVTAITPTPLGEGKTTTTVGLSQALGAHLGKKVITAIRSHRRDQPSGSKAERQAVDIRRSSPWKSSTCISPAISTRSQPRTISSPRRWMRA